jgi:hypothetical protein
MPVVEQPAELWTLQCGSNRVRCVAAPHPLGVELRYVMNDQPLMSRVFGEWDTVAEQAEEWRARLASKGWVEALVAVPRL